tara:strand:- start:1449 stop:1553 length:105 start_codon:yes stop_codon:yes gene_type:complete
MKAEEAMSAQEELASAFQVRMNEMIQKIDEGVSS